MTEREAYIAFNLLPDTGAVTVNRLIAIHGSAAAAWEALPDKLDWEGKPPRWEREIEHAAKAKVTLVTLLAITISPQWAVALLELWPAPIPAPFWPPVAVMVPPVIVRWLTVAQ